jgi:hypothetical protein
MCREVNSAIRGMRMKGSTKHSLATKFVQLEGLWKFEGNRATFVAPIDATTPVGICLSPSRSRAGTVTVQATLGKEKPQNSAARVLIGYNATTGAYWSVGLGGYGRAYVTDMFNPGQGWRALDARGAGSQLLPAHPYLIEVEAAGQRISLSVDHVGVLQSVLPSPLEGNQLGLFAWGNEEVEFSNFHVSGEKPQIFVVMQFGEPYDYLYQEVIIPASNDLGFTALRADDVFRPGIILEDIRRGLVESDVIIAEITPVNANVFYELGYAHALNKPTILLANRNTEKLPFDISS